MHAWKIYRHLARLFENAFYKWYAFDLWWVNLFIRNSTWRASISYLLLLLYCSKISLDQKYASFTRLKKKNFINGLGINISLRRSKPFKDEESLLLNVIWDEKMGFSTLNPYNCLIIVNNYYYRDGHHFTAHLKWIQFKFELSSKLVNSNIGSTRP